MQQDEVKRLRDELSSAEQTCAAWFQVIMRLHAHLIAQGLSHAEIIRICWPKRD